MHQHHEVLKIKSVTNFFFRGDLQAIFLAKLTRKYDLFWCVAWIINRHSIKIVSVNYSESRRRRNLGCLIKKWFYKRVLGHIHSHTHAHLFKLITCKKRTCVHKIWMNEIVYTYKVVSNSFIYHIACQYF